VRAQRHGQPCGRSGGYRSASVARLQRDIRGALGCNRADSRRPKLGADDRWLDKAQRPRTVMPRAGAALICAPPSEPERSYTDITDENGLTQIGGLIGVNPLFRCSSVYRLYCQWRPTPLPQSPITNHQSPTKKAPGMRHSHIPGRGHSLAPPRTRLRPQVHALSTRYSALDLIIFSFS
jgi:hypothetical protein